MQRTIDTLFRALARRERLAAGASIAFLLVLALAVSEPVFSGSIVAHISERPAALIASQEIAAARGNEETMLVVVSPGTRNIGDQLDDLERLEEELEGLGLDAQVSSLQQLRGQLFLLGLEEEEPIAALLEALRSHDQDGWLVARDGSSFVVAVTVAEGQDDDAYAFLRERELGDEQLVLANTGLERDVADGLRQDVRVLIPAIVIVMLAILLFAFRRFRSLALPVFGSIASTVAVLSVLTLSGTTINLVTILALPIVLIVALANSCHFMSKAKSFSGSDDDVIEETLRRVGVPYLVSCLTTAVALASVSLNDFQPLRELGLVAAASLLVSFVLILLFAPLALRWHVRLRTRTRSAAYDRFSGFLYRSRGLFAAALLVMAVGGAVALPSTDVNSDPRMFFPDTADFTVSLRRFESDYYAFAPMRVLIRRIDGAATDLELLRFAGTVRQILEDHPGIARSNLTAASRGGGFIVTAFVRDDDAASAAVESLEQLGSEQSAQYELVYASAQMVYASIDAQAMSSLGASLALSVAIIFGVILVLFRSLRVLVAALVANALPLLSVFSVIWLVGDELNLVTAFVFLVALGVIVDDTIHILWRERTGEEISGSAIEYSVVLSTIMLCAGLLLCQLSDFSTTRQFATYCALALTGAVISDLTVLPAMLRYRGSRRSARSSQ